MVELEITKLSNFYSVLGNPNRLKIVLLCSKNGMTVTQLSEKLDIGYGLVSDYVNILAKEGIVSRKRNPDRTVTVTSLVKINDDGSIKWL